MEHHQELFPVKIIDKKELSPGTFLISWERKELFTAGQVVKISVDEEIPPRIYSICSGTQEKKMSILFDVKQQGFLTPRLAGADPGTSILVSQPYGSFTCDLQPAYWVATGTGIAPFRSMLRSGLAENKIMIHGARHLDQFFFSDEFKEALGANFIPCSSQDQSPMVFSGRITDYLSKLHNLQRDYMYYLCGGGMMVVEVRDLLIEKGVPFEHILSEIFF